MSSLQRRYEILLPLRFNDGRPVPDNLIADTPLDLETKFGVSPGKCRLLTVAGRPKG
jgi:hypothetical protein